jgi:prophage regulatory protein
MREVCARTSLSRTTLWRLTRSGAFPAPILISGIRKAFVSAEIEGWIESKMLDRPETRH